MFIPKSQKCCLIHYHEALLPGLSKSNSYETEIRKPIHVQVQSADREGNIFIFSPHRSYMAVMAHVRVMMLHYNIVTLALTTNSAFWRRSLYSMLAFAAVFKTQLLPSWTNTEESLSVFSRDCYNVEIGSSVLAYARIKLWIFTICRRENGPVVIAMNTLGGTELGAQCHGLFSAQSCTQHSDLEHSRSNRNEC